MVNVVSQTGRVIVVSGSTLTITFLSLVFFPLDFLRSVGIAASLTMACTRALGRFARLLSATAGAIALRYRRCDCAPLTATACRSQLSPSTFTF